jgi:glycosyltransferase involved in cell wall biosynthesis
METTASPLVSILIPLYNHERFVPKCLDSVIEDDYPAKEIIVIDDGSSDESATAVKAWYDANHNKVMGRFEFVSRPNKGLTKTLNELVSLAQGEFVTLLASDDYLLPGGIRARLDYLLRNSEKMAVFADCVVVDALDQVTLESGIEGIYGGRKKYFSIDHLIPYEIIFFWSVPGPVFMARRAVYETIGNYDETLTIEDWDFYLRLAAQNAIGFIDHPVAAYRMHGNNSVQNMAVRYKQLESLMLTARKNKKLFNGIKKYRLVSKMFLLKSELLKMKGNNIRAKLYLRIGNKLYRIVTKLYNKKLNNTELFCD